MVMETRVPELILMALTVSLLILSTVPASALSDQQNQKLTPAPQENNSSSSPGMPEMPDTVGAMTVAIIAVFSVVFGGIGMVIIAIFYKRITG